MFGIKIKKLVTQKEYTIEELFEAIKDKQFTAGTPSLTKNGFAMLITFPALDRNNQVQISQGQMKKPPFTKWTVTKGQEAGVSNMVANAALDHVTNGWSSMSSTFGNTNKACEKLVETTFQELEALGL